MHLLFIRHVETKKNVFKQFSNENFEDSLTELGRLQADALADFLKVFIHVNKFKPNFIYTSKSIRSIGTAQILSAMTGLPIKEVEGLTSINLGEIGGLTEEETAEKFPEFFMQLKLYRNGLFNSYEISYPKDAETPLDFEIRIKSNLNEIISRDEESLKIFILHRSVLTATYISFARKINAYPEDFYGYVPIDNGCITLITKADKKWSFKHVNQEPHKIII